MDAKMNIAAILYVGGDLRAAQGCNEKAQKARLELEKVCGEELARPRKELRADRIVDAARKWAEEAHMAADAVRFAVQNADRISPEVGEAARRIVDVADELKAKQTYAALAQLQAAKAGTEAEWAVGGGDIAWLEECAGKACVYGSEDEVVRARAEALRVVEEIVREWSGNMP